jgi:hypothetical protein
MTRSTIAATLKLWAIAADVLSEEYASELLSWCTGILSDSSTLSDFRKRFGITFRVDDAVLEAIKSLLSVASPPQREAAARLVLQLPAQSLLAQDWARIVLSLDAETFRAIDRAAAKAKVTEVDDFLLKNALLRRLAADGDMDARELLIKRAETDVFALSYIPDHASLNEPIARRLIAVLATSMLKVREQAARNSFGMLGFDHAQMMVELNLLHPAAADWDSLFGFLADLAVASEDKQGATWRFVAHFDGLDDNVRTKVREVLPALLSTRFRHPSSTKQQPEAAWYLRIMFGESAANQEHAIAVLLGGDAAQRRVAAQLLGRGIAPNFAAALNALLADESVTVQTAAAFALGRIVARDDDDGGKWVPAMARVVADVGASVPASFIEGVSEDSFAGDPGVLDVLEIFKVHASARVRRLAEAFFKELLTQR